MAKLFKNNSYLMDLPIAEADTGLMISTFTAAYDAVGDNLNDVFEIKLDDGTSYYCEIYDTYNHKWSLYMAHPGFGYNWLADFVMHIEGVL